MGDQVGQLSYGVIIEEDVYLKLQKHFFKTFNAEDGYDEEKDEKSVLTIENPYETYDYLLMVRESKQSSYNGTMMLPVVSPEVVTNWTNILTQFLTEHGIEPAEPIGWMLTGRYN